MKFRYKAKQGPHHYRNGVIEATAYREAIDAIIRMGLTPVDVQPVTGRPGKDPAQISSGFIFSFQSLRDKIFQRDVVSLTRYLADFLNSGLPLLRALQLIRRYFKSGRMQRALEKIEVSVKDGESLSQAIEAFPDIFSPMYVNMIRAGEISGSLDETVRRLADFLEQDRENRLKAASSLIYPAVIVSVAFVTVFILLTWVIPRVMVIFDDMNQEIPLVTRLLMAVSFLFARFWWAFLGIIILSGVFLMQWHKMPDGRLKIHRFILSCPVIGILIRDLASARFSRTLATLIEGGTEIVPALTYAARVVDNQCLQNQLMEIVEAVSSGESFTDAAGAAGIFSEADISILSVGEETGSLSAGLFKLAAFYEKSSDRQIKMITTLLEPGIILGLGLVVGFMVLAMLMPIFQINFMVR